jgi:predicted MPP superfamily phosphohydrolase
MSACVQLPFPVNRSRCNRRRFLRIALLASPFAALADAVWCEPGWVKTSRLKLCVGKSSHRLVHFSDIHYKGDRKYLEGVVRQINSHSPDFVCFTGDMVEESKHLQAALDILQGLRAPLFGVPGNHDYWSRSDFGLIARAFSAAGGAWLLDQSRDLGGVTLHGATCNQPIRFTPKVSVKNIVLMHYPAAADELPQAADLVLAGHSHGGQVRIPFFGPIVVPFRVGRYDLGRFATRGGPLYVSSGIGWFYANIRFNCRPEIALIEI